MGLIILDKYPKFSLKECFNKYKTFIKFLLGQKRGPDVVISSLLSGLKELNVVCKYNVKVKDIKLDDAVYINGSVETLKWAIEAKKRGEIKKIIVGPVMSVLPSDHGSIMMDKEIDLILFPSQWTKNHWLSFERKLENKIQIWPAGVDFPDVEQKDKNLILIYYKKAPKELFNFIKDFFDKNERKYKIIKYGKYNQKNYFSLLGTTKMAIFLSEAESQGLAMFEAWARGVPTLVWNRGYWQFGNHRWKSEKISSPYLVDVCGVFFKGADDFEEKFKIFVDKAGTFRPREYIMNNFTNKKIAENFLKLIN